MPRALSHPLTHSHSLSLSLTRWVQDIEAALIDPGTRANRKIRFNDEADKDLTFIHRFQSTGRVKNLMSTDSGRLMPLLLLLLILLLLLLLSLLSLLLGLVLVLVLVPVFDVGTLTTYYPGGIMLCCDHCRRCCGRRRRGAGPAAGQHDGPSV